LTGIAQNYNLFFKLKNYFIIPLTLAFIFSGCEIIREEGQNEKSALEYAAEDQAAKAAVGNDFMFLCRKKTNISGTYAGKTAYLISYNVGNHDTNVNNVGKAFLVKPGYLAAEPVGIRVELVPAFGPACVGFPLGAPVAGVVAHFGA